jgi:hypothetical protein
MDRSIRRLPRTAVRLSITVRWASITIGRAPSIPAVDRPAVPAVPAVRRLAVPARRRVGPTTRRRLAIAAVLAAAIVLFATVPARVARLAMDRGIWDLPRLFADAVPRPDLSHVLPLLLGSIVVLAVVSSSGGHHHHDHW